MTPEMNVPETSAARAAILQALRSATASPPLPLPVLDPYLAGPYGRGARGPRIDPGTLIEPFTAAARAWRAEVLHADVQGWAQAVRAMLMKKCCFKVAIGSGGPCRTELARALRAFDLCCYERPLEQWKPELFDTVDAGVTDVEAAVADTGTLVLCPGPAQPRALSLVPPLHVAVLRASRLYASLPAAMAALAPQADMPTNLLLISGPSKTADIQQTLAYGAHGPKELVIVLVDDLGGAEPQADA